MLYPLAKLVGRLLGKAFGLSVAGHENIPHGGCVIVVGHHSGLDPLPLAAAFSRRLRFLGTATYFRLPIGLAYGLLGAVPIRRGQSDRNALSRIVALAARGEAVVVFPEGTRRTKGLVSRLLARAEHHRPYPRRGAAHIAITARVPILPVGLRGPRRLTRWQVRIGAPIDSTGKTVAELTEELWRAITRLET